MQAQTNPSAAARIGYTIFWVRDVKETARFFEAAFGFARKVEMQTALTPWIELDAGGGLSLAFAAFAEADVLFPAGYRAHAAEEAPVASAITVVGDDVEALFSRAVAAGAATLQQPRKEPWGQTIARVRDPNGIVVSIASPIRSSH
ncbi:MAG: VOC family protein [Parvularculaceae bacterium]|nr:VOC family protein [Parvularculaceae bacterium]